MQTPSNRKGYRNAVAVLSKLSKKEVQNLLLFLDSPYATELPREHPCIQLLRKLLDILPKQSVNLQDDSAVFAVIFPDSVFSQNKYDRMMSDAQAVLKKFIVAEQNKQEQDDKMQILLQARFWRNRGERDLFQKLEDLLVKHQKTRQGWDSHDFYWNYLSEIEMVEFRNDFNQHKSDINFQEALNSLDAFYFTERLFITSCFLTQYQATEFVLPEPLFPFEIQPEKGYWKAPLGQLLSRIVQCAHPDFDSDETIVAEIEQLLKHPDLSLSDLFLQQFELIVGNYYTRQINRGKTQYQPKLFELYLRRIENGHIFKQGKIMANEFQSIIAIALKVRELDWVYDFLEANKDKLAGTSHPEDAYDYNYCDYLFHRFCYGGGVDQSSQKAMLEAILKRINQAHFHDMHYKRAARVLEIKVIYEDDPLCDFEFFLNKLQALRTFIARDEYLHVEKREGYNLFAKSLSHLVKYRLDPTRYSVPLKSLREEILHERFVVGRDWILEKLKAVGVG